jgi:hypothetical protein
MRLPADPFETAFSSVKLILQAACLTGGCAPLLDDRYRKGLAQLLSAVPGLRLGTRCRLHGPVIKKSAAT